VKRQKKLSHLEANIVNATLVALQEVHGSDAEIRAALARFRSHWYIEVSAGPDRATGGVVIMVRTSALRPDATVANCVVVAGRVLRVVIKSESGGTGYFWCVHNFGLNVPNMAIISNMMQKDIRDARTQPMTCSLVVAGDWNFLAPGETQSSLGAPKPQKINVDAIVPARSHQGAWQKILDALTELQQHGWTYYVPGNMTCSRLDRIYSATPAWHLISSR
jgi:hypothetical protein